jgi:hypothetical protein
VRLLRASTPSAIPTTAEQQAARPSVMHHQRWAWSTASGSGTGSPASLRHEASDDITDFSEEHGHRVLRVCGRGTRVVLIPLPPAGVWAPPNAIGERARGPILLNGRGARMDRHATARRMRTLAEVAGVRVSRTLPHMLRYTFATIVPGAGVGLRGRPDCRAFHRSMAQGRSPALPGPGVD